MQLPAAPTNDMVMLIRATADPDDDKWKDLLDDKCLWPEVEGILEEVSRRKKTLAGDDPSRPSDAILEFLQVLRMIRRTFLQDVPFLMEAHPDHPTWKHEFFKTAKFEEWRVHVLEKAKESHKGGTHSLQVRGTTS